MSKCTRQGIPSRGKAGDYSWYVSIRGLIMRVAKNLIPKDRQSSEAQRLVQMAWANLIILWRVFNDMLSPSFRTRKKGETEPNAFVKDNWKMASVFLTKEMVKHGACVIPPVTINIGTLQPSVKYWKDSTDNWVVTNLLLGDLVIDANTTVGQFTQALMDCNSPQLFAGKRTFIDFFQARQSIDINTHYPEATITGRHLELDKESAAKLWEVTGGNEGFRSYKGHLATPYAQQNLYAWLRFEQTWKDEYRGTTQSLLGDNNTLLTQYTGEQAFENACASYGGFDHKFLVPFKAKLNPFHYDLPTAETVAGQNPEGAENGGSGSGPTGGGPGTVEAYTITPRVEPDASFGTITMTPSQMPVPAGSQVRLTATPAGGKRLNGWSTGSTEATITVTVTGNETVTATFSTIATGGGGGNGLGSKEM